MHKDRSNRILRSSFQIALAKTVLAKRGNNLCPARRINCNRIRIALMIVRRIAHRNLRMTSGSKCVGVNYPDYKSLVRLLPVGFGVFEGVEKTIPRALSGWCRRGVSRFPIFCNGAGAEGGSPRPPNTSFISHWNRHPLMAARSELLDCS